MLCSRKIQLKVHKVQSVHVSHLPHPMRVIELETVDSEAVCDKEQELGRSLH